MRVVDLLPHGLTDYREADRLQRQLHEQVRAGGEDAVILAEFQPTYTAGRHTHDQDIPDHSLEVIHVDRAGSVTWHGPGQLVVYPIVRLAEPIDLVAWIRAVEGAVLDTVRQEYALDAVRIQGRAGVWLRTPGRADRKLCAIGLKVSQGATLHGLALNIAPDLSRAFTGIIPCGLADATVTTLDLEGVDTTVREAADLLVPHLLSRIGPLLASAAAEPRPPVAATRGTLPA